MRVIISVIALVLTAGMLLPAPVEARVPTKASKWGCTFVAKKPRMQRATSPWEWYAQGHFRCPGKPQKFIVALAIYEDLPGKAIRLHNQFRFQETYGGPSGSDMFATVGGGKCRKTGKPPANPYFLRVKVRRKGNPGAVWVASPNRANPCAEGTYPA